MSGAGPATGVDVDARDLRRLAARFGIGRLQAVSSRRGGEVLKGVHRGQVVYLKRSTQRKPFEKEVEILRALQSLSATTPRVVAAEPFEQGFVLVTGELPGRPLDAVLPEAAGEARLRLVERAGLSLASFHKRLASQSIRFLGFWREGGPGGCELPSWRRHFTGMVGKWVSRVRFTAADRSLGLEAVTRAVLELAAQVPEPAATAVLHCDYVGRNIIIGSTRLADGLLDFEAAQIGDPAYDAAKFVWVALDWASSAEVDHFIQSWAGAYGCRTDPAVFRLYVAAQAVAAIAWCDKDPGDAAANHAFRARAAGTLATVGRQLLFPATAGQGNGP